MKNDDNDGVPLGTQLAMNLQAVFAVGGRDAKRSTSTPLRKKTVSDETGIARSTLYALVSKDLGCNPNPDLHTLSRIAESLEIPVAFLLMKPEDWNFVRKSISGIPIPIDATTNLQQEDYSGTDYIEKVLRICKVHPDKHPLGGHEDLTEKSRMDARDEWRRRTSQIMAALVGPTMMKLSGDRTSQDTLAAFIASFVNETTPNEPAKPSR